MNKFFIAFAGLLLVSACSGTPGNPNVKSGINPGVSVTPKFDAQGNWKVVKQDCTEITFADGIFTVTGTKDAVQNFVSDDAFDSIPGAVVGIMDVQSGDLMFCYNGTVEKCDNPCQGMVDAKGRVEMTCLDFLLPAPTCALVLQKS